MPVLDEVIRKYMGAGSDGYYENYRKIRRIGAAFAILMSLTPKEYSVKQEVFLWKVPS